MEPKKLKGEIERILSECMVEETEYYVSLVMRLKRLAERHTKSYIRRQIKTVESRNVPSGLGSVSGEIVKDSILKVLKKSMEGL